jgi:hypothetical protein
MAGLLRLELGQSQIQTPRVRPRPTIAKIPRSCMYQPSAIPQSSAYPAAKKCRSFYALYNQNRKCVASRMHSIGSLPGFPLKQVGVSCHATIFLNKPSIFRLRLVLGHCRLSHKARSDQVLSVSQITESPHKETSTLQRTAREASYQTWLF